MKDYFKIQTSIILYDNKISLYIGIKRGKPYQKNEEVSGLKVQIKQKSTWKLNWYVLHSQRPFSIRRE